ncbi:AraC-type DNA-binding protein [Zobellia uliginosa]|uniref:AraC-type DNA-binding protein n=1 Tax=Zobellia uliginosa TaxID=143224 RepID=A0ABY1L0Q6_9FLAO|nr:AraC family transcriptional regulator [Zobellia uliginosa]SIT03095.1 AraC-type DNA-binding protein [Zobellia uliginosa]
MKAISQKITLPSNKAFEIRKDELPHFYNSWHFHSEIELTLILKSKGRRFIGDHIDQFSAGDLVLIGPNLPHLWQNDAPYYENTSGNHVSAIIIHFDPEIWGSRFLTLEGIKAIDDLLKKAKYGIRIDGPTRTEIGAKIEKLTHVQGFEKLMLFFEVLNDIATNTEHQVLATSGFVKSFNKGNDERLDKVYEYVMEHLTEKIDLDEAAKLLNLSKSAFCRFFKKKTRKTFSQFVKEARIGYACKLLQSNDLSTSQICYECGFDSFTYFSRSFKTITGKTPTLYRNQYNFNSD